MCYKMETQAQEVRSAFQDRRSARRELDGLKQRTDALWTEVGPPRGRDRSAEFADEMAKSLEESIWRNHALAIAASLKSTLESLDEASVEVDTNMPLDTFIAVTPAGLAKVAAHREEILAVRREKAKSLVEVRDTAHRRLSELNSQLETAERDARSRLAKRDSLLAEWRKLSNVDYSADAVEALQR